ncbi:hypothetical protein ES705_16430 [subsurface metagenome]
MMDCDKTLCEISGAANSPRMQIRNLNHIIVEKNAAIDSLIQSCERFDAAIKERDVEIERLKAEFEGDK